MTVTVLSPRVVEHTLLFTNVLPCFSLQAELYTGGGAEYYVSCGSKDSYHFSSLHAEFLSLSLFIFHLSSSFCVVLLQNKRALLESKITKAQNKKLGMWSLGSERISAADHKRGVTSKKAPVPVAAARSRSSGSAARGGAQAETGRSSSKANQGRGSNALESVMTGLEFVG